MHVVDLTTLASSDLTNHGKFASGEVLGAIGERLAEGQSLSEARAGLIGSLGLLTTGAIKAAADVATGAVAAPARSSTRPGPRSRRHRGASRNLGPMTRAGRSSGKRFRAGSWMQPRRERAGRQKPINAHKRQ